MTLEPAVVQPVVDSGCPWVAAMSTLLALGVPAARRAGLEHHAMYRAVPERV